MAPCWKPIMRKIRSSAKISSVTFRRWSINIHRFVRLNSLTLTLQTENVKIKILEKCDFKPMYEHFEREREKKKGMTKEEKKQCAPLRSGCSLTN